MIMGGIPYYLKLLDREMTLNDNIDALFFKKRGELWDEFDQLYRTLFSNDEKYIKIIKLLSSKRGGFTRSEIAKKTALPPNGLLSKMLLDLSDSGFVRITDMYGRKKRDKIYQLSDYFTIFYFRYVHDNAGKDEHLWRNAYQNRAREAWEGLTFEQVCKDHIMQIKRKLGISGVLSDISSWFRQGDSESEGAQIDLLIDRQDKVINLCEIKFSSRIFEINKDYDESLKNKLRVFRETTGTNKTIQLNMITTFGVKQNKYSNIIGRTIELDDLFEKPDD